MFRLLIACLVLLLASVATAQPLVLSQMPGDGVYVLTVQGGKATLQRAAMLDIGPPSPVDPVDPVDPIPDDDRAELISNLIQAMPMSDARHQNAIKFAGLLKFLAEQVANGTLPPDKIERVYGPTMAVGMIPAEWSHIHKAVLDGLKTCSSPAACANALEQYALGAMSTVPNKSDPDVMRGVGQGEIMAAAEEYGFDWSEILKLLLPLLLALLQNWLSAIPALLFIA